MDAHTQITQALSSLFRTRDVSFETKQEEDGIIFASITCKCKLGNLLYVLESQLESALARYERSHLAIYTDSDSDTDTVCATPSPIAVHPVKKTVRFSKPLTIEAPTPPQSILKTVTPTRIPSLVKPYIARPRYTAGAEDPSRRDGSPPTRASAPRVSPLYKAEKLNNLPRAPAPKATTTSANTSPELRNAPLRPSHHFKSSTRHDLIDRAFPPSPASVRRSAAESPSLIRPPLPRRWASIAMLSRDPLSTSKPFKVQTDAKDNMVLPSPTPTTRPSRLQRPKIWRPAMKVAC